MKSFVQKHAAHAEAVTERIKAASIQKAQTWGREVRYLPSAQTRKGRVAKEIAARDGITEGLICVLTCVEPCSSFEIFRPWPLSYYSSTHQSEWATDVLFRDPRALAALYPRLVQHGMTSFSSPDVVRFLWRKVPATGLVDGHFAGQIVSDLKVRPEGVRIKHRINGNSVKVYDKQGRVLRVETTINEPKDFKIYRPKEGGAPDDLAWRTMRRGVADLGRRAMVSQAANDRYLDALAEVDAEKPLGQLVDGLCCPVQWKGKRVRDLREQHHRLRPQRMQPPGVGFGQFPRAGRRPESPVPVPAPTRPCP